MSINNPLLYNSLLFTLKLCTMQNTKQIKTLQVGSLISLNTGKFKVVFLDDDEIRIQRTTEPMIVTAGDINKGGIKLMGWNNYKPYTVLTILFLCLFTFKLQAQTKVKTDAQGNYVTATVKGQKSGSKAKETGKYFVDKDGKKYPVMESKNGKLFIVRISKKTGNPYNQYILTSK